MPRRQSREVPRWRRGKTSHTASQVILGNRQQAAITREVLRQMRQDPDGAKTGKIIPPGSKVMATTNTFRYRRHLVPFAWIAALYGTGLLISIRPHPVGIGLAVSFTAPAAMLLLTRHLSPFARKAARAMAGLTALWLPFLAAFGAPRILNLFIVVSWLPVLISWVHHYRFRPQPAEEIVPPGDIDRWDRLAAKNNWKGRLGVCDDLPGGGKQWHIVLDGAETHIGQVMTDPRKIAAAWGRSITEAYVEASPDGVESKGLLTILRENTLEKSREWDGHRIDLEAGMAVVGRFPDGKPAHERYFVPRNGVRHTIVAGADGSGKTGLLDLGLCLSATSGIIAPVILDPQEGQALPAWKDHVPYACGADECMAFLYGLHAGLLDRSRYLAGLKWTTPEGHERKGMGFFDAFMTGLPIIEITVDESPALLTDPKLGREAGRLLADIGKRGRKAGFRLRLAVQVPSLSELGGDAQALRSMLVGGNVFCGRTGDKVSGGMVAIDADPSGLPKYFADQSPTVGLGYASGPDNRPSTPMRWEWVPDPYKVAESAPIRPLDDRLAAAMDKAMGRTGTQLTMPSPPVSLAAVPVDESAPEGRTCSDAILSVLSEAHGTVDRGTIIKGVLGLSQEWGRAESFKLRTIGLALEKLLADARIVKPAHNTYALPRTTLTVVAGNPGIGHSGHATPPNAGLETRTPR